jgi:hypothetical protein
MLVCRCGESASSRERDHGHAEQANQDTSAYSRWRALLPPAGIRVRAATENCNRSSIQLWPRGANDLSSPLDGVLDANLACPVGLFTILARSVDAVRPEPDT